jgi:hypothetical protein
MAIYHLSMKSISRGNGRSATAAAAYRAGEKIADVRTGVVHDYARKRGVEYREGILPGGGGFEREEFWNRIEMHHKRGDAVVAREIEVALPAELSRYSRQWLAAGFALEISERYGVAADVSIHAPGRDRDQRNHHAHILLSACHVAGDGTPGKKAVELDPIHCKRHGLETIADRERPRWAELANEALERAGVSARVDHRSLEAQGVERLPQVHLGPNVVRMERRDPDKPTERGDIYRQREEANAKLVELSEARERIEAERELGANVALAQEKARSWAAARQRKVEAEKRTERAKRRERQMAAAKGAGQNQGKTARTPSRGLAYLEQLQQNWAEQYFPEVLEEAGETLARIGPQFKAVSEQIAAHYALKPGEPEYPKEPRTFLGFTWPPSKSQYEWEMKQYEADQAKKSEWKKMLHDYQDLREKLGDEAGRAQAILRSDPKDKYTPLRRLAAERARADDPERWDKLDRDIGKAHQREHSLERGRGGPGIGG